MAYTPGPWVAEDRGHRVHGIRFFWLVPDKVSLGSANPDDAALAAAAPDLLAKAQDLLAALTGEPEEVFAGEIGDEIAALRIAVARAKGE